MKKLFLPLVCLLLISVMALSVFAAESSVAVVPSSNTLDRGDTFTLVAELTNSDPIMVGTVALTFDESVFELTGGTCHVTGANPATVVAKDKAGTFFLGTAATVSGKIFTFEFKVKADAPYGTYNFTTTTGLVLGNGQKLSFTATGGNVTVACRHTYGQYTMVNTQDHQRICSKCGDVEQKSHEWVDGDITTKPSCEQGGEMERVCRHCGAKTTVPVSATGHAWDNDCDTDCNNGCGLTRTITHKYGETFSSDGEGHWYGCSVCGDKKDFAPHTPGPEATTENAQVCLDCNFEIAPKLTHTHQMSTEWVNDDTYHWHRCQWSNPSCYYVEDKAEHDYDNDCDATCNTCGYVRLDAPHNYSEEWMGDADGHWFVCLDCFGQSETKSHIPGPEATETEPQRCKVCNIVIKMPLNHEHVFGPMWYYDEDSHWQCCNDMICFETTDPEPHTWDEGLDMASGGKRFTCTACGKEMTTEGPAPTQPSAPPTTVPTTAPAQKDEQVQDKGGFSWEWIAIAAIILLVIGFILLIIEFIRSRRRNSHGRFSK